MRIFVLHGLLAVAVLLCLQAPAVADPPPDLADWLTWTTYDTAGDPISLSSYQNQSTFVVLFSSSNEEGCNWMGKLADYIRANPNKASKVLCMCTDDTGAKGVKLHLRQEEWKKRVAAWEEAQEAARIAAQTANEVFVPDPMPDFLQQIKDELDDPGDLADLMAYHLPCKTACRCDPMWRWMQRRMTAPRVVPRVLKFASNGTKTGEWSTPPAEVSSLFGS